MREVVRRPDLERLGVATRPLGKCGVHHAVHVARVGRLVGADLDAVDRLGGRRRLLECDPDDPRHPRGFVAPCQEHVPGPEVGVGLRLSHLGIPERLGASLHPLEQGGPDPAGAVGRPDIAFSARPIQIRPTHQFPVLEHQLRVKLRIESTASERNGDVVLLDFGDAIGVDLAGGDQLEDGPRVGRRRGPRGEAGRQVEVHAVLHPGHRSPPTGPGSVSIVSSAPRTSSNVSHRRYGTPSCSQICTSASLANTTSEYRAP